MIYLDQGVEEGLEEGVRLGVGRVYSDSRVEVGHSYNQWPLGGTVVDYSNFYSGPICHLALINRYSKSRALGRFLKLKFTLFPS